MIDREQSDPRGKDRHVLLTISVGLIAILLSIIWGLFLTKVAMPGWAENVLVSIATATALKLGDCLSTLVALASGRSVERLGEQLGTSAPAISDGNVQPVEVVNQPSDPIPVEVPEGNRHV